MANAFSKQKLLYTANDLNHVRTRH